MKKSRSMQFRTTINIISSVGLLAANYGVSFFLSPYIIRTIGVEANGFVTLANNFIMYADIIVMALNAMAARFIAIAYIQKDYEKANLYYNSVFWGNIIIDMVLFVPSVILIIWLERFVDVPKEILVDVKILFAIIFFAFFLRTGLPNWDCGTYISNRLDRTYIPNMCLAILRVGSLVGLFWLAAPHVWYVGFTSCLVTICVLIVGCYNTHHLTPELKVKLKKPVYSWYVIRELVGSGIWSSIANVGNILFNGLDLLICNLYLGSVQMGVLALSKTLAVLVTQLGESIRGAVGAELTISYANGDKKALLSTIQRIMKMTGAILPVIVGGVLVLSEPFYGLWVPSQDAKLLWLLTSLAIINRIFNSGVVVLYNVYSVVNKVRINAVIMLISGAVSIAITMIVLQYTNYPLYAIAGVSSVVTVIKEYGLTVPITSHLLGYKWYQFYPQVAMSAFSTLLVIGVGIAVRMMIPINTWFAFFAAAAVVGTVGLMLNVLITLNREERLALFCKVKSRIPFLQ